MLNSVTKDALEFRRRAEWDRRVDAAEDAREFLADAHRRVDAAVLERRALGANGEVLDVVEYLKRKYPAPLVPAFICQTLPARFKREPNIFLAPMRFGRTRLFLSRLIGDLAWRGWRARCGACGARGIREVGMLDGSQGGRLRMRAAICLALPMLVDERECIVECHSLIVDGKPDLATLDPDVREIVAEFDRAIEMCSVALIEDGGAE